MNRDSDVKEPETERGGGIPDTPVRMQTCTFHVFQRTESKTEKGRRRMKRDRVPSSL